VQHIPNPKSFHYRGGGFNGNAHAGSDDIFVMKAAALISSPKKIETHRKARSYLN
jgi:hypothetical protein